MSKLSVNILELIIKIWSHVSYKKKYQFLFVFILSIFTSFTEIFSLGALVPFLSVLTDPEALFNKTWMEPVLYYFKIKSSKELVLPLTIIFIISVLAAGLMRLLQSWANIRVSYSTGADLSLSIYERTLYRPYSFHLSQNTSSIINAISSKAMGVVSAGILPVINIITQGIILMSIIFTLIFINPIVALSGFFGLGLIYFLIIIFTRYRIKMNSFLIANESSHLIKNIQEGLGGVRDVLIDGSQNIYKNIFSKTIYPLRLAQASNLFISQSPRFIIEAFGMVIIASLAYLLANKSGSLLNSIPVLGALAFGAQRMLPIFQLIYSSLTTLSGNKASMKDVFELLDQPLPRKNINEVKNLDFVDKIELKNINFRYNSSGPKILSNLNFTIKKGSKVGIIGETGCGKSTILDIVMSLLTPTSGELLIDGNLVNLNNVNAWQKNITHVPQTIFLSDATIEENIAFGLQPENINHDRVQWAAKQAHVDVIINSWPKKYNTLVGERGVRLSGGQRQRIGIARALYKNAKILIFDEATSALDNETELKIIKSIENLQPQMTLIFVAHRLTSLKNCSLILRVEKGEIKKSGSYNEVIGN